MIYLQQSTVIIKGYIIWRKKLDTLLKWYEKSMQAFQNIFLEWEFIIKNHEHQYFNKLIIRQKKCELDIIGEL